MRARPACVCSCVVNFSKNDTYSSTRVRSCFARFACVLVCVHLHVRWSCLPFCCLPLPSLSVSLQNRFGDSLGEKVWEACNAVFDRLPLAGIIDHDIFCVHGGIPRPLPDSASYVQVTQIISRQSPLFSLLSVFSSSHSPFTKRLDPFQQSVSMMLGPQKARAVGAWVFPAIDLVVFPHRSALDSLRTTLPWRRPNTLEICSNSVFRKVPLRTALLLRRQNTSN